MTVRARQVFPTKVPPPSPLRFAEITPDFLFYVPQVAGALITNSAVTSISTPAFHPLRYFSLIVSFLRAISTRLSSSP